MNTLFVNHLSPFNWTLNESYTVVCVDTLKVADIFTYDGSTLLIYNVTKVNTSITFDVVDQDGELDAWFFDSNEKVVLIRSADQFNQLQS